VFAEEDPPARERADPYLVAGLLRYHLATGPAERLEALAELKAAQALGARDPCCSRSCSGTNSKDRRRRDAWSGRTVPYGRVPTLDDNRLTYARERAAARRGSPSPNTQLSNVALQSVLGRLRRDEFKHGGLALADERLGRAREDRTLGDEAELAWARIDRLRGWTVKHDRVFRCRAKLYKLQDHHSKTQGWQHIYNKQAR
jgi:hypothetical protein